METYGISDYTKVAGRFLATLVCGLGRDSRVGRKLSGIEYDMDEILLARVVDAVEMLLWAGYGGKHSKRPKSVLEALTKRQNDPNKDVNVYKSGEDFDRERSRILAQLEKEINNG